MQSSIISQILEFFCLTVTIFSFDHMTDENEELPVLRCEVAHCQLTPLFTYILSNFLKLISNGRSERLAIFFMDDGIDKT